MDSTPSPPHSTQRTAMPGKRKVGGYCREQRVPCVKLRMSATAVHASPKQRVVCENVSSRQLPLHHQWDPISSYYPCTCSRHSLNPSLWRLRGVTAFRVFQKNAQRIMTKVLEHDDGGSIHDAAIAPPFALHQHYQTKRMVCFLEMLHHRIYSSITPLPYDSRPLRCRGKHMAIKQ